jgi:PTS system ascorbate-specific IIB component
LEELLRIKVDEVLQENGIKADVFCADEATAKGERFDILITSKDMAKIFTDIKQPMVVVNNFMDKKEIAEKCLSIVKKLMQED